MGFTIKHLADGQLANSKGTLYSVPASTDAIVKSIILVNTGAAHNHVNLYFCKAGGTSRRLIAKDLQLEASYSLTFECNITMGTEADLIQGDATNATEVDYVIFGTEYTA